MLRDRLTQALKDAMRAKDPLTLGTVRMMLAGIKDRDIAARPAGNSTGIDDGQIASLLQAMIKQRQESIGMYRQGNRQDLVEKEATEIAVIEGFLPQQLDEAATETAVAAVIAELGATTIKDMGKVMAELRARHAGQMDFAKAGPLVKQALTAPR